MKTKRNETLLIILLCIFSLLLIWSFIKPFDIELWFYEAGPAIIGTIVLLFTYRKFKFTQTTYVWWFIAACLMAIGAHYSYSHVPLFNWLREPLNWERNNYDKVGHLVQGVVPVLIVRELMIKTLFIKNRGWINLLSLAVAMAISAMYEITEWLSLYVNTRSGSDFLGSQGYMWDAQSDMLMALIGGVLVILLGTKNLTNVLSSSSDPLEIVQRR